MLMTISKKAMILWVFGATLYFSPDMLPILISVSSINLNQKVSIKIPPGPPAGELHKVISSVKGIRSSLLPLTMSSCSLPRIMKSGSLEIETNLLQPNRVRLMLITKVLSFVYLSLPRWKMYKRCKWTSINNLPRMALRDSLIKSCFLSGAWYESFLEEYR